MKYLNKLISVAILSIFLLSGCDDGLNLINPNSLSPELLSTDEKDLKLQLVGCYDMLQNDYLYGKYHRAYDALSGIAYYRETQWRDLTNGVSNPETGLYFSMWSKLYGTVVRANNLIANIDNSKSTDTEILQIKGEAMFIRALAYFNLLAFYKDVPYISTPQTMEERFVEKDSEPLIKENVLKDLQFAIENLPVEHQLGRAGLGAALALKSRVHMYFDEMSEVASLTQQIINLNKYALFPNYEGLFDEENEGNSEVIFSVSFESGIGEGEHFSGSHTKQPYAREVYPLQSYVNMFYCTDGLPTGLPTIINTPLTGKTSPLYDNKLFYENRDPRMDATIVRVGEPTPSGKFNPKISNTGYAVEKYLRKTTSDFKTDGPVDYIAIRFAEVLLARAEALLKTNGISARNEIYALIDEVRSRVNMPSIATSEETQLGRELDADEILMVIKHERFVELGTEGLLWFDVKRWGDVESIYEKVSLIETDKPIDNRPYRGDRTLYWPIPQTEIDNNPNLNQHSWWIGGE